MCCGPPESWNGETRGEKWIYSLLAVSFLILIGALILCFGADYLDYALKVLNARL